MMIIEKNKKIKKEKGERTRLDKILSIRLDENHFICRKNGGIEGKKKGKAKKKAKRRTCENVSDDIRNFCSFEERFH